MSTLGTLRAKRARDLQAQLQALAQFRRSSRHHVAAIAKQWRPLSKRLVRSFGRLNAVLPEEMQLDAPVETPTELLANLIVELQPTWDLADTITELRKLGPKLAKIEPVRRRKANAKREAARKALEKDAHIYEQMAADLADETRFQNRLHNANLVQDLERKRRYGEKTYRVQLAKWISEYERKRLAVGLPVR